MSNQQGAAELKQTTQIFPSILNHMYSVTSRIQKSGACFNVRCFFGNDRLPAVPLFHVRGNLVFHSVPPELNPIISRPTQSSLSHPPCKFFYKYYYRLL